MTYTLWAKGRSGFWTGFDYDEACDRVEHKTHEDDLRAAVHGCEHDSHGAVLVDLTTLDGRCAVQFSRYLPRLASGKSGGTDPQVRIVIDRLRDLTTITKRLRLLGQPEGRIRNLPARPEDWATVAHLLGAGKGELKIGPDGTLETIWEKKS